MQMQKFVAKEIASKSGLSDEGIPAPLFKMAQEFDVSSFKQSKFFKSIEEQNRRTQDKMEKKYNLNLRSENPFIPSEESQRQIQEGSR